MIFQLFMLGGVSDENEYFDRWTRHYSEAVNANLCPYFEWFKVKVKDDTKKYCETLPGTLILLFTYIHSCYNLYQSQVTARLLYLSYIITSMAYKNKN